jgi:hypothetical protein
MTGKTTNKGSTPEISAKQMIWSVITRFCPSGESNQVRAAKESTNGSDIGMLPGFQ